KQPFIHLNTIFIASNIILHLFHYLAKPLLTVPRGEMQNTLISGSTGSGKTQVISDIVEQIRKRGDRAIIYDAKCDYVSWFYDPNKDYILNPFDERGEKWNLLAQITDEREIKGIISGFIPEKDYGDKIWEEAARVVCSAVLKELFKESCDLTNQEILDILLKKDAEQMAYFLKDSYAKNLINPESPKTAYSVLFVISSYLNALEFMHGKKSESFIIKNWMRDAKDSILFITSNPKYKAELMPLETAFFEIAIRELISQKKEEKTWFIIDELPTLQKIPSLSNALAVSRASGGCFVLGIQNIAQLREIYSKNGAQNIVSECNTKGIFRTNDPDTAKWASDLIGDSEVEEFKEGLSYGAHKMRDGVSIQSNEKRKNIIMPSEFLAMPNLDLVLKISSFPSTKATLKYKGRINLHNTKNDVLQNNKSEVIKPENTLAEATLDQFFSNYII
ncbi:type IV secretion system DNA-binding domain-containing protein, partial [Candidatus Cyrtobacter comes]|uniref:type IV secretion system DNA-binding domain-containing protein n=1 Tax=Candidatus Cyrtobacter comes TaxID=675776 RepID=UPI002ACD6D93